MFKSMLGFITGVILLYFSGDLINSSKESLNYCVSLQLSCLVISFLLLLYALFSKEINILKIVYYLNLLFLGFSYAHSSVEKQVSARIPSTYDQQIIKVKAFLCSLPKRSDYSYSADFCLLEIRSIENIELSGKGFKARLRWPLDMDFSESFSSFYVKSRQPRSTVNFIGNSFEDHLFYEDIVLMGEVKELVQNHDVTTMNMRNRLLYEYHQLRKKIGHYSNQILAGRLHEGVIGALLLGDKSQLSSQDYKVLANTGTQHLIAISGLHVGLVMLGVFYLLPKRAFSIGIVSIIGMAYVLLVGFTPSAQRAWVMCVCGLIYYSGHIKQSKWKPFVLALFLILLFDPLATFNLGFWYSFLCVAIIFVILQFTLLDLKKWSSLLLLQLLLMIAMIPVSSLLATKHGLENILANIFAIPWISLLVLPLTLLGFFTSFLSAALSSYLLDFVDISIEILSSYLASLRIITIPLSIDIEALSWLSFILVFVCILIFNKVKYVLFTGLCALAIAVIFPSKLYRDDSELMVLDVGQGLALAIKSKDDIWLYDTGPAFDKSSSTINVILPYLRRHRKSNELSGVIVSHGDADHAGDLFSLYDEFRPVVQWSGQPERLEIGNYRQCEAGMHWRNSDVLIEILYPFSNIDLNGMSSNNHSCVARIRFMGKTFLLMGDLESDAEMAFVKYYRNELKADVLIAGHHGAAKSSSFALLKHVDPDYIVFSAGYLNKFGHPSESVLERVSLFEMETLNTSRSGAIRFKKSQSAFPIIIETARE